MTLSKRIGVAVALAFSLIAGNAYGDDPAPVALHIKAPAVCSTAKTPRFDLPPGYFDDEHTRAVLDAEVRRLQDAETRLSAENASLRASASVLPSGWATVITAVSAIAAGITLDHYAF